MRKSSWRRLVYTALFTALTTVATMVIQVPMPMSGYVNLGDAMVLLSAWFLGPLYGSVAAGIGSMLADLLSGYAYYAPGTLVVKGLMAVVAALVYSALSRKSNGKHLAKVVSGLLAESVMVAGYFGYAGLILGNGLAAALSIPGNVIQGGFGVVVSTVVCLALGQAIKTPKQWKGQEGS